MTTLIFTPFKTSFDKYVPCDYQTYKKLKLIRKLIHAPAASASRWDRAQSRLLKNRFNLKKVNGKRVKTPYSDAMVFATLWTINGSSFARTELCQKFWHDYEMARRPHDTPGTVGAPQLETAEIDQLIADLQAWILVNS